MILARLSRAIREQNWFAVVLEFLVVVAGVLMAFAISSAASDRDADRRSEHYLVELRADLTVDLEEIAYIRANADYRMSALYAIMAAAGAPPRAELTYSSGTPRTIELPPAFESDDPFAANSALTAGPSLDGSRHTYNSLISTGDFGLFRNTELSRDIQAYYARVDEVRDFEVAMEHRNRSMLAARHTAGISAISSTTLDELAQSVVANPALRAEMETFWYFNSVHRNAMDSLHEQAQALIDRIDRELAE